MQLEIEKWIVQQGLNSKVLPLFQESIKSYKAGAYKAGLLFSYLGFMTILKERLLKSAAPPGISTTLWSQITSEIQSAETWDKSIFEATQRQNPATIFPVSDSIRREVIYWKDRRNDCAHFKHEKIDYHHVESFWSFMYTNLAKFAVNGGMDALIKKFKDHFDPSLTRSGTDLTPLIQEIEGAVEQRQMRIFFESIAAGIDDLLDNDQQKVFNAVLDHYHSEIADELIAFLKQEDNRLLDFIRSYPQKVGFLELEPLLVRRLWYSLLFRSGFNDYKIYVALLENNLIPTTDIIEAHRHISNKVRSQLPTVNEIPVLLRQNYFPYLRESIFPLNGIFSFDYANGVTPQIIFSLEHFPLDRDIVHSLRNTFSHPLQPNALSTRLRNFMESNPAKKQEFIDVLAAHPDICLPERLDFITT